VIACHFQVSVLVPLEFPSFKKKKKKKKTFSKVGSENMLMTHQNMLFKNLCPEGCIDG
jgi:hypothetical protein